MIDCDLHDGGNVPIDCAPSGSGTFAMDYTPAGGRTVAMDYGSHDSGDGATFVIYRSVWSIVLGYVSCYPDNILERYNYPVFGMMVWSCKCIFLLLFLW